VNIEVGKCYFYKKITSEATLIWLWRVDKIDDYEVTCTSLDSKKERVFLNVSFNRTWFELTVTEVSSFKQQLKALL